MTESYNEERPELMVHVATTHSTVQDVEMAPIVHSDLAKRQLLPGEHVVDNGCVTPAHIERAARVHGITLLDPVVPENSRHPKDSSRFAKSAFPVDWDRRQASAPRARSAGSGGHCESADTSTPRSSSPRPTAWPARSAHSAPPPPTGQEPLPCYPPVNSTRPRCATGSTRPPPSGNAALHNPGPGSKGQATLSQNVRTHGLQRASIAQREAPHSESTAG